MCGEAWSPIAWPEELRQTASFIGGVGANSERAQLAVVALGAGWSALVAGSASRATAVGLSWRGAAVIRQRSQSLAPAVQAAARRVAEAKQMAQAAHRQSERVFALAGGGLARTLPVALIVVGGWLRQRGHLGTLRRQALALQAEARTTEEAADSAVEMVSWVRRSAHVARLYEQWR